MKRAVRYFLFAMTLIVCSLPLEAARRRAIEPGKVAVTWPSMLAFVSDRDGNSEIYLANADGTSVRRLTNHAGADVEPAWSPDGKRIAFVSDRGGLGPDIYIMDADGSNVVRRTEKGTGSAPSWSPDGMKIAFSKLREGNYRVHVMSVDGESGDPTPIGHNRGWNAHPAWSPDGKRIAFVSDWEAFDFVYDVYAVNEDDSQVTTLIRGPFLTGAVRLHFQPSWSPDGGKIAVVACGYAWDYCYPESSIMIANADGSELKTLVATAGYARPAWSPDGSTIAFSWQLCRACPAELRYVRTDGSESGVISWDGDDPAWRPQPTP